MDLELLFTSRDGFGIETASPLQRAICRLFQGVPVAELAAFPEVSAAVGCDLARIPTGQPFEVLDLEPVGCGKTVRDAANCVRLSQVVDVSMIKPGQDPPRISCLSTLTDTARALRGHLERVKESPLLRKLYVGDTDDSMTLRHPTGMVIEIKCLAAHRGGYSLHARRSAGVFMQEAPGWHSTDKVVSLEENRETAMGRILPGGQIVYSGAPWQPSGWCYETWRESFGKPSTDLLVIHARPAWVLNPIYFTPERVELLKRRSPRTFKMHVLAEFAGSGSAPVDADWIVAAERQIPSGSRFAKPILAIDASKTGSDHFAVLVAGMAFPPASINKFMNARGEISSVQTPDHCIVARDARGDVIYNDPDAAIPLLVVHEVRTLAHGDAFGRGDALVREMANICERWGITNAYGDQAETVFLASALAKHGIDFLVIHWTERSKSDAFDVLRRRYKDKTIIQPVGATELRNGLLSYRERAVAGGGFQYVAGRHEGHADQASALVTCAMAEAQGLLPRSTLRQERSECIDRTSLYTEGY